MTKTVRDYWSSGTTITDNIPILVGALAQWPTMVHVHKHWSNDLPVLTWGMNNGQSLATQKLASKHSRLGRPLAMFMKVASNVGWFAPNFVAYIYHREYQLMQYRERGSVTGLPLA